MKIKRGIVLLGLLAGLVTAARAAWEPAYAIVGCRIIPVSGAPIEDGVIVIRNGLIEAVGARAKVPVPEDVEIVDGKGSIAYPGFIDAYSSIFIQLPPEPQPDPNEMFGSVHASKEGDRAHSGVHGLRTSRPRRRREGHLPRRRGS